MNPCIMALNLAHGALASLELSQMQQKQRSPLVIRQTSIIDMLALWYTSYLVATVPWKEGLFASRRS